MLVPAVVVVAVCGAVASASFWMASVMGTLTVVEENTRRNQETLEEMSEDQLGTETFENWLRALERRNPSLEVPELIR